MKLGNLYNLGSMQSFVDSHQSFTDSELGILLAAQLKQVDPKIYEKKYPENVFLNSGISVDNSGGDAEVIMSLKLTDQGSFAEVGDRGGNNGRISLRAEDNMIRVKEYHAESQWSDTEVRQAALQNINLPSRYIETHNKIYLRDIDATGYLGTRGGGNGLLVYTGFTATIASGTAASMTSLAAYNAIADLITAQWNDVANTAGYMANRVDMPTTVMNTLSAKLLDTTNGSNISVMNLLRQNFPTVEFRSTFRANSVNINGNATTVTVAYCNSNDVMVMRIPRPLEFSQIDQRRFNFDVESKYRVAGLDVLEDIGARRLLGL